jgi:hypothetical protein
MFCPAQPSGKIMRTVWATGALIDWPLATTSSQ